MTDAIAQSTSYLDTALKTYSCARHVRDKLLAVQLLVITMIMSTDALLVRLASRMPVEFHNLPDEDLPDVPSHLSSYMSRVEDLRVLEEQHATIRLNEERTLAGLLEGVLVALQKFYTGGSFSSLLQLNFKALLNDAHQFVAVVRTHLAEE
ncbi:MAG: hypothetical protein ACFFGZ_03880 [Candidatus Thorarchaeota archaeon]